MIKQMMWYEAVLAIVVLALTATNCFVLVKFALLKEEMPAAVANFMGITIPMIFIILERFFKMISRIMSADESECPYNRHKLKNE